MLNFLSHRVNLENAARLYYVNFIKNALFSLMNLASGVVIMAVLCFVLKPQPNSAESWILLVLLAIISLSTVCITVFNAGILSSSYCVFAVYRNDMLTITPLSEVALKNSGRIRATFKGSLKAAKRASAVMQSFVERYDFEDFFLDSGFLSDYSHRIVKMLGIRRFGKYTLIRCITDKYNPSLKKYEMKKHTFFIKGTEFENSAELISVLESRLRNNL